MKNKVKQNYKKLMDSNETFKPKIDYNNCLTNLACYIEKYFEIPTKHKSLPYIDDLLNEKKTRECSTIIM